MIEYSLRVSPLYFTHLSLRSPLLLPGTAVADETWMQRIQVFEEEVQCILSGWTKWKILYFETILYLKYRKARDKWSCYASQAIYCHRIYMPFRWLLYTRSWFKVLAFKYLAPIYSVYSLPDYWTWKYIQRVCHLSTSFASIFPDNNSYQEFLSWSIIYSFISFPKTRVKLSGM